MSLSWRGLAATVAAHAAALAFLLAAQQQDLVSRPDSVRTDGPDGLHIELVARPFAFGRCVPFTTSFADEPYRSVDEILGEPVHRCTGWPRPLGWAAAAAAVAGLIVLAIGRVLSGFRREAQ